MRAARWRQPLLILAGGSNVVLADDLTDLTVVLLANTEITVEGNVVRAEAGAVWDDVVATSPRPAWAASSACPASRVRPARRPCRTSARTASRWWSLLRRVQLLDRRAVEVRWVEPSALGLGHRTSVLQAPAGRAGPRGGDPPAPTDEARRWVPRTRRRRWARKGGRDAGPTARCATPSSGCAAARAWCSTRRPRHVECRVLLHRSGDSRRACPLCSSAIRRRGRCGRADPAFPGARDQAVGGVAHRTRRVRQGLPGRRPGPGCPPSTRWR